MRWGQWVRQASLGMHHQHSTGPKRGCQKSGHWPSVCRPACTCRAMGFHGSVIEPAAPVVILRRANANEVGAALGYEP
jgi:hypothetical protein